MSLDRRWDDNSYAIEHTLALDIKCGQGSWEGTGAHGGTPGR